METNVGPDRPFARRGGVNPLYAISRLKRYRSPALMHAEAASCQCESLKMTTLMRAIALAAVTAVAALFIAQPVQAATAAVQPHSIIFDHASDTLIENVGRRGGWGRGGYRRGGWGYRGGIYRRGGWGYRRGLYRRGLYGSRYGYYRPYRRFYGGGLPAYGYGYGNDYGYGNGYGYANDYGYNNDYGYDNGYGNGYGYSNDYGYGDGCGCGNGYGYGSGAPVVTFGFGGWGGGW